MNRKWSEHPGQSGDLIKGGEEQIVSSNAIQPHAVLLVVERSTLELLQVSQNVAELGQGTAADLIGCNLNTMFGGRDFSVIQERLGCLEESTVPVQLCRVQFGEQGRDVFAHAVNGAYLLELEREELETRTASALSREVRSSVSRLDTTGTIPEFLNEAVALISRFSGFERVMVFRIHEDGSGGILASTEAEGLAAPWVAPLGTEGSSLLGRDQSAWSRLRFQPDLAYRPVQIVPETDPLNGRPVDLRYALSRSVADSYSQYLKHKGVRASMVLPLSKDGKRWGAILCTHNHAPRHVSGDVRDACELLAQFIFQLLLVKEDAEAARYREKLSASLLRLLDRFSGGETIIQVLAKSGARANADAEQPESDSPLSAIDASGVAIVTEGKMISLGELPPEALVGQIAEQVAQHMPPSEVVWFTDSLRASFPKLDAGAATMDGGVLAARVGRSRTDLVLWFRPECPQRVPSPEDPPPVLARNDAGDSSVQPDDSFSGRQDRQRSRCRPWLECEIQFAREVARGILDSVEREEQTATSKQQLTRSNRELEEFVYTASHDLKEPLRGIHNNTQLVLRSLREKLSEKDLSRLEGVVRLTQRMDQVIEGLLDYSRVGNAKLLLEQVDLGDVCSHVVEMLQAQIDAAKVEIRIPRPLPTVQCDLRWTRQLLFNLVSNAVKYGNDHSRWVEIGYQDSPILDQSDQKQAYVFYVRDNGIGIAQEHGELIFQLFRRLHSSKSYGGGVGLGLAIANRAAERHGGRLWFESEVGAGTTFFFTLGEGRVPDSS